MANAEHVRRLKEGVKAWNGWRKTNSTIPDFRGADLSGANLRGAALSDANLTDTDLRGSDLTAARLDNSTLVRANLTKANLSDARLDGANLRYADLTKAILVFSDLSDASLLQATLTESVIRRAWAPGAAFFNAKLDHTQLLDMDLSSAMGLDTCSHASPSIIDHATVKKSGWLPSAFLDKVVVRNHPPGFSFTLVGTEPRHDSCFISSSAMDAEFAGRLHADLEKTGVVCWMASHDMPIGGKIIDEIDKAIRLRDKLLVILSKDSIASDWVEFEVIRALAEERERGRTVLFPIQIDDAVRTTSAAWARMLRDQRNIGDFTRWTHHGAYITSFDRLLRGLRKGDAG